MRRLITALLAIATAAPLSGLGTVTASGSPQVTSHAAARPSATVAPSDAGSLWRQTDANPSASRDNPNEKVLTAKTVKSAVLLRTLHPRLSAPYIDETCSNPGPFGYASSPLFEPGGRLFVAAENAVDQYDPATGKLKQAIAVNNEGHLYLSVAEGLVYTDGGFCSSVSEPPGDDQAHDASTGKLVWYGSPASGVGDADVFTAIQDRSRVIVAGPEVLSALTGLVLWSQPSDVCHYVDIAPTVVAGPNVVTGTCALDGFNLQTGARAWQRKGGWEVFRADRDSVGGTAQIYARAPDGVVVALGANHGATLFRLRGAHAVLAAGRKEIYATCGSNADDVCAYSKTNGSLLWQAKQNLSAGQPLAAVGGDVIYLDNGAALDVVNGKMIKRLWSSGTATDLSVGDGYVAVDVGDGALRLYGLPGH